MFWVDALLVLGAMGIDRGYGEWPARMHPVVWMGKSISFWEQRLLALGPKGAFVGGAAMAVGIPTFWAGLCWLSLQIPYVSWGLALLWLKSTLALRVLGEAGMGVAVPLKNNDLSEARARLSWLCSRDASTLRADQVAAGAVESLAENLSDSLVAPLFWFAIAGVPGAVFYRSVNTLDAMIGYHGRYEWLGKASARLDDVLNLVPARLTALLLLGAGLGRVPVRAAFGVLKRDRYAPESPNAGFPMAVMAGLLGICLEKPGHYRLGKGRLPEGLDIEAAWGLCQRAAGLLGSGLVSYLLVRAYHEI